MFCKDILYTSLPSIHTSRSTLTFVVIVYEEVEALFKTKLSHIQTYYFHMMGLQHTIIVHGVLIY